MSLSREDLESALEAIERGDSLRSAAKALGKHPGSIYWALAREADLWERYESGKAARAELDVLDIEEALEELAGCDAGDGERVRALEARIRGRQWLASKRNQRAYGERMNVELSQRTQLVVTDYTQVRAIREVPAVAAVAVGAGAKVIAAEAVEPGEG